MRWSYLIPVFALSVVFGQDTRTCSDAPQGIMPFNSDWYYSEFVVPENFQVTSLYGGFSRPGYIPAHYDYIAQFYRPGQVISTLNDFQLFNYDLIDEPLYNREYNVEHLGILGEGILRLSVPVTHGVLWNQACVSLVQVEGNGTVPEAVPEPSSLALISLGLIAFAWSAGRRSRDSLRTGRSS